MKTVHLFAVAILVLAIAWLVVEPDESYTNSILFKVDQPQEGDDGFATEARLFAQCDSLVLSGIDIGLVCDNANLRLDSTILAKEAAASFDETLMLFGNYSIDSCEARPGIKFNARSMTGDGLAPDGKPILLATYYFNLKEWLHDDSLVFDTLSFGSINGIRFYNTEGDSLVPGWRGRVVVYPPSAFDRFWASAVDLAWSPWLVYLLIGAGLFFTIAGRLLPFRAIGHTIQILRGKYDKKDDPGEINHFQALSSALSATIGMGNIAGVAIAISTGGPGAIFWMWIAGLVGMSTKFYTCTLATLYRKKDENGIDQGGPMYYLEVGLGKWFKPLAIMFAVCGMIGCLSMFQVNQLAGLLNDDYGIPNLWTGVISMVLVGMVIVGGITRVGKVTSKAVPSMFLLYLVSALIIIIINIEQIPHLLATIISSAFGFEAVAGGAIGVALMEIMRTGVKRAAFSNEAGVGTAPMAHGAAKTKEPVREGLIAMLGPFLDTNIVCTLTALVILSTGVLQGELSSDAEGVKITALAFKTALGSIGGYVLLLVVVMFSVSTMISYSYYSLKCAKYLLGIKVGGLYVWVYLLSLPAAALLNPDTVVNIIDTCFALMAIPTLIGALLLSGKVTNLLKDYIRRMKQKEFPA